MRQHNIFKSHYCYMLGWVGEKEIGWKWTETGFINRIHTAYQHTFLSRECPVLQILCCIYLILNPKRTISLADGPAEQMVDQILRMPEPVFTAWELKIYYRLPLILLIFFPVNILNTHHVYIHSVKLHNYHICNFWLINDIMYTTLWVNLIYFQWKFYYPSSNDPSVINIKVRVKCKICIATKLFYSLQNQLL